MRRHFRAAPVRKRLNRIPQNCSLAVAARMADLVFTQEQAQYKHSAGPYRQRISNQTTTRQLEQLYDEMAAEAEQRWEDR